MSGKYSSKSNFETSTVLRNDCHGIYRVTTKDDPMNKKWHSEYSSAWLKPNANLDMAKSGLQVR